MIHMERKIKMEKGFFGEFGGSFIPPELQKVMDHLAEQFEHYKDDSEFMEEFRYYLKEYVGRESPLTFAKNLTKKVEIGRASCREREKMTVIKEAQQEQT